MSLFRKLQRSFVLRTGFALLSMLVFVLGAGFTVLYFFVSHLMNESVNQNADLICREKINQFDQAFFQAEDYANMLAPILAEHPQQEWTKVLSSTLKAIVAANEKNILAIAAATMPDDAGGKLSVVLRNPAPEGVPEDDGSFQILSGTKYADESWFAEVVKEGKGKWIEPFLGRLVPELLTVYSRPVFRVLPDGEKKIVGVVCIDMRVQWLDNMLEELHLPYSGTAFLFSKKMQMLSTPKKDLFRKNFIYGDALNRSYSYPGIFEEIEQVIKRKESGQFTLHDKITGKTSRFFLYPMKSTGWSFGIVFEESLLGAPLRFLRIDITLIAALSVCIVVLFVLKIGRRITHLLNDIKLFSREIGMGNLSAPLPDTAWSGEFLIPIAAIDRMRRSLAEHIEQIRRDAEKSERIESELLVAQRIQYGLVPNIGPSSFHSDYFEASARLLTAKGIGGDFYDCTMVEPGLLGFTIGDVSGKGISASLFMVFAQIIQRVLRGDGTTQSQRIVSQMNHSLFTHNRGRLFVTFLGGFINAETGLVNYCNAGHPPFVILKNDGTLQESGPRNGIPLGMKDNASYTESNYRLEPGESLVLYTDGITDAEDANGNFFGMERFRALLRECAGKDLSANEIERKIMKTLCDFSRVHDRSDDIACLVIRYKEAKSAEH